jgi:hypothetical protein
LSEFKLFAERATLGDTRGAIKVWENSSAAILSEYRKVRDDEEGDEWYSGEYAIFDKLFWSGVKESDSVAIATVKALIEAGVMLNESDRDGYTPVGLLSMSGNLELLKHAVAKGGDVNAGQTNALSMLFGARQLLPNWREIADYLFEVGADVNGRSDQASALFAAVRRNHRDVIEYLVQHGADTNRVYESRHTSQCGTAMHYSLVAARTHGTDIETARQLVQKGGDPTVKNREGLGAVDAFFAADLEPTGDVQEIVKLYASREDWRRSSRYLSSSSVSEFKDKLRQDKELKCPNCAETVKFEAKACRFCGQVLNDAVKRGFPEFYHHSKDNLSREWLLYDYVDHVLPGYGGSLTAPNVFGNLLNYGTLEEYDDYQKVRRAMRAREAELAGGEIDASPDLPDSTPHYWSEAKPEQRALYLVRRYVELAQDYTKRFGGKDMRQDPSHLEHAISELGKLADLAERSPLLMDGYAVHFRSEIENCIEQLNLLGQGRSLADGRSASEKIREAMGRVEASRSVAAPEASSPSSFLKPLAVVMGFLLLGWFLLG